MTRRRRPMLEHGSALLTSLIAAALTASFCVADDPKPSSPTPSPSQAARKKAAKKAAMNRNAVPTIAVVYPAGGARGTTVSATLTGTNLAAGTGVRVAGDGVEGRIVEVVKPTEMMVDLAIAADAAAGLHDLRVVAPGGVSNRVRFDVGELPEVAEVEPNDRPPGEPQAIATLPVTVNGRILEGDRDLYRFRLKAGQTVVCDVLARPLQPFIADAVPAWLESAFELYGPDGRKLVEVDDFRFRPDPLLAFKVPADGDYTLLLKDVLARGRSDFVYRLTIGELPYVTGVLPLGGQRGTSVDVHLDGVNLPTDHLAVSIAPDAPAALTVGIDSSDRHSNDRPFAAEDWPSVMESAATEPSTPQRVAWPVVIDGRIDRAAQADTYEFEIAEVPQTLALDVLARRLDSPLDSALSVLDATGRVVAANDDTIDPRLPLLTHQADSHLLHTFRAAGAYKVRICDARGQGEPASSYRLAIGPPRADYALRVTPDNLRLVAGETAMVTVNALRFDGFGREIDLAVEGLPAGFVSSPGVLSAGQEQASLTITSPADARPGILSPRFVGRAKIPRDGDSPGRTLERVAEAAESVMQAFTWTHVVPVQEYSLTIVEASAASSAEPSYRLEVEHPADRPVEVPKGAEVRLRVRIVRDAGMTGQVSITAVGLPPGITAKPALIAEDQDSAELLITAAARVRVGMRQNLVVRGSVRNGRVASANRVLPAIPFVVVDTKTATP